MTQAPAPDRLKMDGTAGLVRVAGSPVKGRFEVVRELPPGSEPLVKVDDRVEPDTVIATGHLDRRVLRLPPGDNFEILKKPGDTVKKGETVAVTEELFGLGLRELVSPADCVVESIGSRNSSLVVAGLDSRIRAIVPGAVKSADHQAVRILVSGERITGWFGLGRPVSGPLHPVGDLITDTQVRRRIGPEVRGRVVVAESFVIPAALPALARYGAAGLICGGLDFAPLWELISPTGDNPAGRGLPTVVMLEGFGTRRLRPEVLGAFSTPGSLVYACGPSTDRLVFAGPPHPEVILIE